MVRFWIVAGLASSLLAVPVWAQKPPKATEAESLFEQGSVAYEQGAHVRAAELFERAHAIAPHGATILNAARSRELAGDGPRAADDYAEALRIGGLSDEYRELATARLAGWELRLGRLRVDEPKGAALSVRHLNRKPLPVVVHLEPGTHQVIVEGSDGSRAVHEVRITAGATERLAVPAAVNTSAPPRPSGEAQGADLRAIAGGVLLGLGVVGAGVAVGFGIAALDAREDYEAAARRDRDAGDRAATLRTATNVAWVTSGALAIAGSVFVILALSDDPRDAHVALRRGETPLSWRF